MKRLKQFFFDSFDRTGGAAPAVSPVASNGQEGSGQQQQAPAIPDPFEGVDLDLLDEDTKSRVTKARETIKASVEKANAADQIARKFQSQHDQLLQHVQRQVQQPQQQQQAVEPPTLEQEIAATYIELGYPADQAAAAAKVQAKIMGKVIPGIERNIAQSVAPYAQHTAISSARQAFDQARATDRTGALNDPEIGKKVYDTIAKLAESGKIVDVGMVQNLRNVFAFERIEQSWGQPQQQQQPNPQSQPPVMQPYPYQQPFQSTFPQGNLQQLQNGPVPQQFPQFGGTGSGSGGVVQPPQRGTGLPQLDSDTMKAVEEVKRNWMQSIPGADKKLGAV